MSAFLTLKELQVGYGNSLILDGINLTVQEGEMIALLGPSGCGKTTLLNALCGFLPTKGGAITVGGRDLTHVPPEKRNMAMVFQSYALWPHMSVKQNIAYGLKLRKLSRDAIEQRVSEILTLVNLTGYESRSVTELSGGQRQRVALGRALAVRPPLLLLDEPLSNLDARIRLSVRHEIKSLQKQLGFTAMMVTHDREEAMVMADRIVVLNDGKIEQVGMPQEIYQQPATAFVTDFMGADNHMALSVSNSLDGWVHQSDGVQLKIQRAPEKTLPESQLSLFFRSEAASVQGLDEPPVEHHGLNLFGKVQQSAYLGNCYRHSVQCGERHFQIDHPQLLAEHTSVQVHVPERELHVF